MKQKNTVTIFDVAKEAGVSYSTVSRVATGYQFVKPATRVKVEAVMDRLGYVANLKARSLAGGRSQMLGLLVDDLKTSYLIETIRGIDEELSQLNYDMMLSTTHHHKEKESAHVRKLSQGMVDGLLIVLPTNLDAYVEDLSKQDMPFVLINHTGNQLGHVSTVRASNYQGMYDATVYLIELGHRDIGFVMGAEAVGGAHERFSGYQAALAAHGIAPNADLIVQGDYKEASGHMAGRQLAALPKRPTAIICSNDEMAFGTIMALQELGLRVPQDVSIVGFDDIPESSYFRPKLTTVRQPMQEMGRVATRILVEKIEKPETPASQIVLPTELILRESTAPPPESN